MYMEMFEKVFNLDEISFDKLFEEIMKLYEKKENAKAEKESYFNSKGFKYQNGKLVDGFEKECVNGKCVKDESFNNEHEPSDEMKSFADMLNGEFCAAKKSEDPSDEMVNNIQAKESLYLDTIIKYEKQIKEMKHCIDNLNNKINSLQGENNSLRNVINNIKNCF